MSVASLGRSSAMIAAGTMTSRITGIIRTILLAQVLGSAMVADAFEVANNLPNTIFNLVSAGLLTAVFVPQIVKAAQHEDGGVKFVSKLFTLSTVLLVAIGAIATVAAPILVTLNASKFGPEQHAFAVALAYWCIPQVLFYGLFALVGETLNARKVYGPYTWAPIVNNLVSGAGLVVLMVMFQSPITVIADWTPDKIAILGGTATGGVVAQLLVLMLFWRRAKLPLRPDFQWRGVGLGDVARLGGWTFLMALVATIAGLVQGNVLSWASDAGYASSAIMNRAWLIYIMPWSVIILSIGTPYFTRIAEFAAKSDKPGMLKDIDAAIRTLGVFIVLATAAIAAAAVPTMSMFTNTTQQAVDGAWILWAYLANLIPVAILFIIQRTFYVYGDTRTPFLFTVLQGVIVVITAVAAWLLVLGEILPMQYLGFAVAAGQTLGSIIQMITAVVLLHRKLGTLNARSWLTAYARFLIAGLAAGVAGAVTFELLGGTEGWTVTGGIASALIGMTIIALACTVVYVAMLAIVRAPELRVAVATVRRKLGR